MTEKGLEKACSNGAVCEAAAENRGVTVTPAVDILERDGDLVLYADLPGVAPGDVDVRFENGELTVHGKRTPNHAGKVRQSGEADVTNYFRSFRVSEQIAADKIEAGLKNGRLTLRLPKIEAAKPRRIAVNG
ncbi:MAG TPA: Hsp20/alpha crystallin family protein [Fimbriiglobus sp.]|jgi:HSP20 family protein